MPRIVTSKEKAITKTENDFYFISESMYFNFASGRFTLSWIRIVLDKKRLLHSIHRKDSNYYFVSTLRLGYGLWRRGTEEGRRRGTVR